MNVLHEYCARASDASLMRERLRHCGSTSFCAAYGRSALTTTLSDSIRSPDVSTTPRVRPSSIHTWRDRRVHPEHRARVLRALHQPARQRAKAAARVVHAERQLDVRDDREDARARRRVQPEVLRRVRQRVHDALVAEVRHQLRVQRLPRLEPRRGREPPRRVVRQRVGRRRHEGSIGDLVLGARGAHPRTQSRGHVRTEARDRGLHAGHVARRIEVRAVVEVHPRVGLDGLELNVIRQRFSSARDDRLEHAGQLQDGRPGVQLVLAAVAEREALHPPAGHRVLLDDGDPQPERREVDGRGESARAGADDHDVG